jgi:hypothetical protein
VAQVVSDARHSSLFAVEGAERYAWFVPVDVRAVRLEGLERCRIVVQPRSNVHGSFQPHAESHPHGTTIRKTSTS